MTIETASPPDLAEVNRRLNGATPREILRWGVETYFPKLTMATAFGPEGCIILHMLAEIEPRVRVFNLETGTRGSISASMCRMMQPSGPNAVAIVSFGKKLSTAHPRTSLGLASLSLSL